MFKKLHPHAAHFPLNLIVLAAGTALTSLPAAAQQTLDTVVVTGVKASLQKGQDLKRNADQIVDSIVADDIGKLPDANVAEALQRIAGVQISRDQGEGSRVQVRGLSQTQTTLNGRAIFTAGKERGLSFQDVPSELLAGADVFKTPTADQLEGGIGGLIDLRTRRPFDFAGLKLAGTVKVTQADLAEKNNGEGSFLVSDRWKLAGGSEFGALLSVASQKRNYRADEHFGLAATARLARSGVLSRRQPHRAEDPHRRLQFLCLAVLGQLQRGDQPRPAVAQRRGHHDASQGVPEGRVLRCRHEHLGQYCRQRHDDLPGRHRRRLEDRRLDDQVRAGLHQERFPAPLQRAAPSGAARAPARWAARFPACRRKSA